MQQDAEVGIQTFSPRSDDGTIMELTDGILHIGTFLAVTIGIVVLFVGKRLNDASDSCRSSAFRNR